MASVHERRRLDGTVVYVLRCRERGVNRSATFEDRRSADRAARAIEAGQTLDELLGLSSKNTQEPTVEELLARHIRQLTGVTDRTREDYERQAARHILPELATIRYPESEGRRLLDG